MSIESTVDHILSTYDELSERRRRRISYIASRNLEERVIFDFNYIYRYIDYLVQRFTHRDDNHISLDSLASEKMTFHELVKDPNENSQNDVSGENQLNLTDALEILRGNLNDSQCSLLFQLSRNQDFSLPFTQDQLRESAPQIIDTIEALSRKYSVNGRVIIPPRPIRRINLSAEGINFTFGLRRYAGDPLSFFRDNYDVYAGLGRKDLEQFDHGLYISLHRAGQLVQAIPTLKKSSYYFTQQKIDDIVFAHTTFQGNASATARALGIDKKSVLNHWRAANLQPSVRYKRKKEGCKGKLSDKEKRDICATYEPHNGIATYAARDLGYHETTVVAVWVENYLKPRGNDFMLSPEKVQEIVNARSNNQSAAETARQLGVTSRAVRYHWKRTRSADNNSNEQSFRA